MARLDNQITLADVDPEYQGFLDKFKPKKTTDDCYTPDNIYDVVLKWVIDTYGIDPDKVVRPFWPGGDYMNEDYPEGCTVVDNPPFSIISKICRTYNTYGVKYFLFAPYLTNFATGRATDQTHIIAGVNITYENGAQVPTAFVTNLDTEYRIRTAPDLYEAIGKADYENTHKGKTELPKYKYPDEVITAANAGYICKYGIELKIPKRDTYFVREIQSQKATGKAIFGGGYLLSEKAAAEKAAAEKAAAEKAAAEKAAAKKAAAEKAAAEKAAAEKANAIEWELSESEKRIVASLGRQDPARQETEGTE